MAEVRELLDLTSDRTESEDTFGAVVPSLGTYVRMPGAATAQMQPPSLGVVAQGDRPLLLPPARVAEPYTMEAWFMNIWSRYGGTVTMETYLAYAGTESYSPLMTYSFVDRAAFTSRSGMISKEYD